MRHPLHILAVGTAGLAAGPTALRAQAPAAGQVVLSGTLRDAATGEALVGATVFIKTLGLGTSADARGAYRLAVPRGTYLVTFTSVGYAPQELSLRLTGNLTYSTKLTQGVQTGEVLVTGSRALQNVRSTEVGVSRLSMKTIKALPALFGEVDPVRSLQLLPGVSTVGEGATGFNVRGGGIDQNLVLLDGAPLYNSSHLFGFFSVFNADAVQDLKLIKGGIPASYGGRLSSVLDVRMKEADPEKFKAIGGLGLVSSRLAIETPLIKDKMSLLVAGRRSYADLFLKAIPSQKGNVAYFYDLNAKLSYQLSVRDHLSLTGYYGRDVFNLAPDLHTDYGNAAGTAHWAHAFSTRLRGSVAAVGSKYDYGLGQSTSGRGLRLEFERAQLRPARRPDLRAERGQQPEPGREPHPIHLSARPRPAHRGHVHLQRAVAGPAARGRIRGLRGPRAAAWR